MHLAQAGFRPQRSHARAYARARTHTHTLSRGCEHLSVALADYPNVVDLDLAFNGIMVLFHLDVI